MDIADRILILRGDRTREQFTEGLKTSAQTLYKYENRTGKPTVEFVEQVCKKFNVSFAWLITGEGPMHPGEAPMHPGEAPQTLAPQAPAPKTPPQAPEPAGTMCARCAKLEEKLEMAEAERRELTAELREVNAENRRLSRENGELREEVGTLRERQKTCCPDPVFKKTPPDSSGTPCSDTAYCA